MTARIVYIEGPKAAGKDTLLESLKPALEAEGFKVLVVSEPGGDETTNPMGIVLRNLLKDGPERTPECEALLFQAAGIQCFKTQIEPVLEDYDYILVNRSIFSRLVYQFSMKGVEWLVPLHRLTAEGYSADLTLWLMPPKETIRQRLEQRDGNYDAINPDNSLESLKHYAFILSEMSRYNEPAFSKRHRACHGIANETVLSEALQAIKELNEDETTPNRVVSEQ